MSWEIVVTGLIFIFFITTLLLEKLPLDLTVLVALALLMLAGIVDPHEALQGFSNPALMVIAALFIVSAGLQQTQALSRASGILLGTGSGNSYTKMLLRMMAPVALLSGFMNNIPLVMVFVPFIKQWSERLGLSVSKFLLPLSYAAILGGMCTLIGTSTNLVAHGLMLDYGLEGLSFFELALVGVPAAFAGILFIAVFQKVLLPVRKGMSSTVIENAREYLIEMAVEPDCELAGKTIAEAGLRNLKGLYLIEIERGGCSIGPVSPVEKIEAGDFLVFTGVTSAIVDLHDIRGLVPAALKIFEEGFDRFTTHMVEAVVSSSAPFLGKTAKEFDFRGRYGAAILAVHRNGQRVREKVGSIVLKEGDTLLLYTNDEFISRWKNSQDFYLISYVADKPIGLDKKGGISLAIAGLMIAGAALAPFLSSWTVKQLSIVQFAVLAAIAMVFSGCIPRSEVRKSIRWDILLVIGGSIGMAKGLVNSGLADWFAERIMFFSSAGGVYGAWVAVYVLTLLLSAVITNKAAIAIVFPIAYSTAVHLGVNPEPFLIGITIATAGTFMTPVGYQTNLIVQGVGGYRFRDYLRVGLPLTLIVFITAILLVPVFWSF